MQCSGVASRLWLYPPEKEEIKAPSLQAALRLQTRSAAFEGQRWGWSRVEGEGLKGRRRASMESKENQGESKAGDEGIRRVGKLLSRIQSKPLKIQ